jgi:FtsH-binding integral membrane protein
MEHDLRSNPAVIHTGAGTIGLEQQRVLRNTYLLLAVTMVPTVVGAFIGMATASVFMAHPIIMTFVMLGAVIGLRMPILRNDLQPIHQPVRRGILFRLADSLFNLNTITAGTLNIGSEVFVTNPFQRARLT